ncbi:MAG TPA: hypothetical protein VE082_04325 [Desulfobaccales bacterium]|nr:hypothetical protein [Desulfobaccales bacterium]
MSKHHHRERAAGNSKGQIAPRRKYIPMLVLVAVCAALATGAFFLLHVGTSPGTGTKAAFDRLQGPWLRPDGGYVIDIRNVDASGKMAAGYFNPRPINVSQAKASREEDTTKVFIELRDVNYPGATYNLTYDPERDQLRGVYYQPAVRQSFDVFFIRMK